MSTQFFHPLLSPSVILNRGGSVALNHLLNFVSVSFQDLFAATTGSHPRVILNLFQGFLHLPSDLVFTRFRIKSGMTGVGASA